MRSSRGFAAAVVFLLAVPLAALFQMIAGAGAEIVIHLALAAGFALLSLAVFDFRTARWIAWLGFLSTGALAAILLLQGLSELIRNESLTHLVYQVLGQRLEIWLFDVFILWCIAVLLVDSRGKTRVAGWIAIAIVAAIVAYGYRLSYLGRSLNTEAQILKVFYLLPFAWLLFEARKTRPQPPA